MIPKHCRDSIDRYVREGIPPGGFVRAVLQNDLAQAMGRADVENRHRLFDIVSYIYNWVPSDCWGSPEKVEDWFALSKEDRIKITDAFLKLHSKDFWALPELKPYWAKEVMSNG